MLDQFYIVSQQRRLTVVSKLTPKATFAEDLGLDSLDAVEVVMAVEEVSSIRLLSELSLNPLARQEFSIEIPDAEADEIKTVEQAIEYIAKTPDGMWLPIRYLYLANGVHQPTKSNRSADQTLSALSNSPS